MRVLKPGGSFFLNISGAPSRPLLPHYVAMRFAEFAVLQNTFHWIKSITVEKDQEQLTVGENRMTEEISVGHFKPLTSDRYVNDFHEYVFHFSKTGHAALDRKAVGVKYADPNRTSSGGGTPRERTCAAGATPGSCLTERSRTATRTARTRPHFQQNSRTWLTALPDATMRVLSSIRSWGSATPGSRPPGFRLPNSSASTASRTI
jgi:hypothetical protein